MSLTPLTLEERPAAGKRRTLPSLALSSSSSASETVAALARPDECVGRSQRERHASCQIDFLFRNLSSDWETVRHQFWSASLRERSLLFGRLQSICAVLPPPTARDAQPIRRLAWLWRIVFVCLWPSELAALCLVCRDWRLLVTMEGGGWRTLFGKYCIGWRTVIDPDSPLYDQVRLLSEAPLLREFLASCRAIRLPAVTPLHLQVHFERLRFLSVKPDALHQILMPYVTSHGVPSHPLNSLEGIDVQRDADPPPAALARFVLFQWPKLLYFQSVGLDTGPVFASLSDNFPKLLVIRCCTLRFHALTLQQRIRDQKLWSAAKHPTLQQAHGGFVASCLPLLGRCSMLRQLSLDLPSKLYPVFNATPFPAVQRLEFLGSRPDWCSGTLFERLHFKQFFSVHTLLGAGWVLSNVTAVAHMPELRHIAFHRCTMGAVGEVAPYIARHCPKLESFGGLGVLSHADACRFAETVKPDAHLCFYVADREPPLQVFPVSFHGRSFRLCPVREGAAHDFETCPFAHHWPL